MIAIYLPQFHPIPENDKWWGKGFTEWTNTAKAKPLYRGHYQPHVPSDLGFYDLRLPEARIAQAELAREYGIEAFCYYHYWFAGRQILERPFNEVLSTRKPDFPFCICWANETWTGIWHGSPNKVLIEQTYPGVKDYVKHFNYLLPAFEDDRYVKVNGKPLFAIYKPYNIPDLRKYIELWRELAIQSGLKGIHFVSMKNPPDNNYDDLFDAYVVPQMPAVRAAIWIPRLNVPKRILRWYAVKNGRPTIYKYKDVVLQILENGIPNKLNYPCVVPNWDNTPRSGVNGLVLHGSTPELFRVQIDKAIEKIKDHDEQNKIIFIKSWNEWAEGNHLEPDLKYGHRYLEELKTARNPSKGN